MLEIEIQRVKQYMCSFIRLLIFCLIINYYIPT